ncbi:MAG: ABC transporter ATP-binding protein [Ramlibacter sp.]|uniref:ABC transporter ATP-binding protein n=1 Tax=Ramlibacter sp. TaxID=1917967 RepID=UPI002633A90E|nr:ABC transporter ATP-binding protein [Ramlibacter sp.]MDH4376213.1 ABC transporter ATP-binding protein [Ramlibacter sp.]
MTVIDLQHLDKRFGNTPVVRDLNLHIADREFLVLLGPSGCGKTTTMRMIAGLEEPSGGDILFDKQRVNDLPTRGRDVAMVFQNYGLYPHMSVFDNIGYPLKLRGIPREERRALVERAADRVQLKPFLHRMPRELSGGQRQRVALARAVVRNPRVFLMDEPLSNLDAKLRVTARAEIKHLSEELGVTTVYVTHDQVEAMTLAHRVAVMHDGIIQQLGRPEDIYSDPANAFVAGFIGSPAMNLVPLAAQGGVIRWAGGPAIELRAPGEGAWTLGVRAEDMQLGDGGPGSFSAEVFTFELLGDCTMINLKLDERVVSVKAPKDLRLGRGARVALRLPLDRLYWFDAVTGERVRT